MTASTITQTELRPVAARERVASLDVLRGIAILGILTMNIVNFGMVDAAYVAPTFGHGGVDGLNGLIWVLQRAFCDQRFMSIFAMLFGVGIVITNRRADTAGSGPWRHYLRMIVLLGIGLVHAYLIWSGDVLMLYALLGMLVVFARRLEPHVLLFTAAGLLLVNGLLFIAFGGFVKLGLIFEDGPPEAMLGFDAAALAAERQLYAEGDYLELVTHRLVESTQLQLFAFFLYGLRTAGLMLLGMAFWKLGVFEPTQATGRRARRWMLGIGLAVGVPLTLLDVGLGWRRGFAWEFQMTAGFPLNYWSSVFCALAYVALLVPAADLLRPVFAPVGRAALTCYLLQSVICTTIFYGYGLGYFGTLDRAGLMFVVFGVWAVLLIPAPLWLAVFRFGPVEWLWRVLSYGRWQPLLRSSP